MRILQLVSIPSMTGAAPHVATLADRLVGAGAEVWVVGDSRRAGDFADKVQQSRAEYLGETGIGLSTVSPPWGYVDDVFKLRRLIGKIHPDVVHCHLTNDHILAMLAIRGLRFEPTLIRTVHYEQSLRRNRLAKQLWKNTHGVITLCEEHRDSFLRSFGDTGCVSRVILNSVNLEKFKPGLVGGNLCGELNVDPDRHFIIGMVARFQRGRGQESVVHAMRRLRELYPDLRLLLVGKGETLEEVKALVERLELTDVVRFTGYRRSDLRDVYCLCHATVLLRPGHDASCRAALESLACATPVIGSRRGGMPDVIGQGENGFLIEDPDRVEAIVDAISLAMQHGGLRGMGILGRRRMEQFHTPTRMVEETLGWYRQSRDQREVGSRGSIVS